MKRHLERLLAAGLLLWAGHAHAMPQAIAAAIITSIGAAGAAAVAITAVTYVVTFAAVGLYAKHQKRKAEQAARNAYNASLRDRHIMVRGAVEPRDLVLGRVRKSGPLVFFGTTGPDKERFVAVVALAAHEIDGIEAVYFNDERVELDMDGWVRTAPYVRGRKASHSVPVQLVNNVGTVVLPHEPHRASVKCTFRFSGGYTNQLEARVNGRTVTVNADTYPAVSGTGTVSYQYTEDVPKARVHWHLGHPDQPAHWRLKELFPQQWGDEHRLRGIAYLVVELVYDTDAFPSSIPNISAVVRGARVYDPRTGSTAWSENPALLMRHYAYHPMGGNLPPGSVSEPHCIAAANACDERVTYQVLFGVPITRPLYTASTVARSGARPIEVLGELAEAMAGKCAFAGNRLVMRAGAYVAPVLALGENDFSDAAEIRIQPRRPREQLVNLVTGTFANAAQDYTVMDFPRVSFASYVQEDGRELPMEVELGAVTVSAQAQHVCRVMLREARQALTLTAAFKLSAYPAEVFDVVTLTSARYGWDAKPFEVQSRRWTLQGFIELTLKETAPEVYSFDPRVDALNATPNTNLPKWWQVPEPGPLTVESGTALLLKQSDGTLITRVRVSWPALADQAVLTAGHIEVAYTPADAPAADGRWSSVSVPGSSTEAVLTGLEDGRHYLLRVRARNSLAMGDWSVQVIHLVVGKTAPPSNVPWALITGNRLTWGPVDEADIAGYRWRYVSGANVNWAAGQPMHDGLLTEASWAMVTRPVGLNTLMVKAVDTSGNESEAPAYVITDLGDPVTLNVLESWPQAPHFAGLIDGGAVNEGVLEADGATAYWQEGTGLHWGSGGAPYWPLSSYRGLSYEFGFTTTAEGTLSIDMDVEGDDVRLQYLREAQTAYWSDDGAAFWPADSDPIWPAGPGWQPWPGNVVVSQGEPIGVRLATAAGLVRGRVLQLTPHLDVPDLTERLDDVPVSLGGTRLPVGKAYRVIKNIQLTVQSDGQGGVGARIVDKQVSPGPLVQVLDINNTSVPGVVDAYIQGY
ncbi:phage tail protein [Eleftheria terrae]|uniref:phage tail protein n=1 Tax=Eleftheria terrae TaxID=1597781 RepID=UPI00263AD9E3|nr:phage tail protein [Eleftheria terrae]WKB52318.1 phage tail protein [Eleftheria terrae]